jgi:hypothetical protein
MRQYCSIIELCPDEERARQGEVFAGISPNRAMHRLDLVSVGEPSGLLPAPAPA